MGEEGGGRRVGEEGGGRREEGGGWERREEGGGWERREKEVNVCVCLGEKERSQECRNKSAEGDR